MSARPVSRRTARWRRFVTWLALGLAGPVVVALCVLRQYPLAVYVAAWGIGAARFYRRWPWCAAWLFRRELDRTRHVGGETHFAYPLAAPVQRRRRVPVEPAATRQGQP